MFDIGMSEMLVVGVVALIVVGPKDLPRMFRTLGEVTGKARKMAREFQSAMNDAAKDSGVNDIAGDLRKMANPKKYGLDKITEATSELSAWSPDDADGMAAKPNAGLVKDKGVPEKVDPTTFAAKAEARRAAEVAELEEEPEVERPAPAPEPDKPA